MTRLRVGVVGVGHLGKEHARILSGMPEVELVGVVDTSPSQAQAIAQKCQTRAFTDYREIIPQVQAAIVVVPTAYHCEVARACLEAGVPVLVEKPFTPTVEEADELVTLARQRGLVLQVGHIERFNPAFEELQRRPLQPKYIRCERYSGFSGRSTDVGVVMDMMIHDLDLVRALVRSPIVAVEAMGVAVLGGNEDMAHATLRFANGCIASLSASRVNAEPLRKMQVMAPEGFALVDFARKSVTLTQPGEQLRKRQIDSRKADGALLQSLKAELFTRHLETLTLDCNQGDQLTRELHDFVHCVTTGSTPRVDGEAGREAVALAQDVVRSLRKHCWDGDPAGPRGPLHLPAPLGLLFTPEPVRKAA
jgi:predicted dehydrogenase